MQRKSRELDFRLHVRGVGGNIGIQNHPPAAENSCPVCGTRAPRDTEFCASCGSPLVKADDVDEDIPPGTVLDGQFRIDAPIGRGGMGTVYKGYDPKLRRQVAIKVLPSRFHTDRELFPPPSPRKPMA